MTYPPQPPGPPQGPYNPYNQGPNPYHQPPPWAGGPPGGFPAGPPPKKPRGGLIAGLVVLAIVVVGGGGVGAYLLINRDQRGEGSGQGGGEGGGARAVAQTYVQELETTLNTPVRDIDLGKLKPITCGDDFATMEHELADAKDTGQSDGAEPGAETKIRIRMQDFENTSDGAKFTMIERLVGDEAAAQSRNMTVAKEDGDWKVCGAYDKNQPGGGSDSSGGSSPSREVPPNPIPTT